MRVIKPETCTISSEAVVAEDVVIYPNNHIVGKCVIGAGCVLMPNNILTDTKIGRNCRLTASVAEDAKIGDDTQIGPYAYLRKGSEVGSRCRVGDFVELKNAKIGDGTKLAHLTYAGDCTVGKDCNVGCGVVFANYDGVAKRSTTVGDRCFIGSNCNILAPTALADGSYVAAGTTVAGDLPPDSFVIGRVRQVVKENRAQSLLQSLRDKADKEKK